VLLAGPNTLEFVVGYLGALHAGAAVAFVSPMSTPSELARVLDDVDPVGALASPDRVEQLHDMSSGLPVLALGGEGPATVAGAIDASRPARVRSAHPSEVAHVAFTSRTTGRPKATPLSHGNVLASIRAAMWAWRWRRDDVLV